MALTDPLITDAHGIPLFSLFALKNGYRITAAAANQTLDDTFPVIWGFDPSGGARDVILDGASAAAADPAIHGLTRLIVNRADGAEALTVKDAAANTIGTISQNEMAIFYHDGIDADGTAGTGWALIAIVSIALS